VFELYEIRNVFQTDPVLNLFKKGSPFAGNVDETLQIKDDAVLCLKAVLARMVENGGGVLVQHPVHLHDDRAVIDELFLDVDHASTPLALNLPVGYHAIYMPAPPATPIVERKPRREWPRILWRFGLSGLSAFPTGCPRNDTLGQAGEGSMHNIPMVKNNMLRN